MLDQFQQLPPVFFATTLHCIVRFADGHVCSSIVPCMCFSCIIGFVDMTYKHFLNAFIASVIFGKIVTENLKDLDFLSLPTQKKSARRSGQ